MIQKGRTRCPSFETSGRGGHQITSWTTDTSGPKTEAFALVEHKEPTNMQRKNTICLWFDKDALDAARFYAATFPSSEVTAVHKAPADYPSGKAGDS